MHDCIVFYDGTNGDGNVVVTLQRLGAFQPQSVALLTAGAAGLEQDPGFVHAAVMTATLQLRAIAQHPDQQAESNWTIPLDRRAIESELANGEHPLVVEHGVITRFEV